MNPLPPEKQTFFLNIFVSVFWSEINRQHARKVEAHTLSLSLSVAVSQIFEGCEIRWLPSNTDLSCFVNLTVPRHTERESKKAP